MLVRRASAKCRRFVSDYRQLGSHDVQGLLAIPGFLAWIGPRMFLFLSILRCSKHVSGKNRLEDSVGSRLLWSATWPTGLS